MNENIKKRLNYELSELSGKNVAVTGGCGFVGRYIVEMLRDVDANVRVFDLRVTEYRDDVTFIAGNLLNMDDVKNVFKGCDIVIHVASPSPTLNNPKIFHNVNVNGTANVISACRLMKVKKLVYTSSASVVFDGSNQKNLNENAPFPMNSLDGYTISKLNAEKLVLEAADNTDAESLAVCAIRPHGIFGPRDPHLMPALARAGKGRKSHYMIGCGDNLVDFTYVENVAFSHLLAAVKLNVKSKMNGKAYFITNQQPILFWDFISRLQEGLGYPLPYLVMPQKLMLIVAWFAGLFSKIFKFTPTFTKQSVTYASVDHYYSSERAYRDFGYIPLYTLDEAINKTLSEFEQLVNSGNINKKQETLNSIYDGDLHLKSSAHPTLYVPKQKPVPPLFLSAIFMPFLGFILFIQCCCLIFEKYNGFFSYNITIVCSIIFFGSLLFNAIKECKHCKSKDFHSNLNIDGKTIVITGGNRGIGFALAVQMANMGAKVILACRSVKNAEKACKEIISKTNNKNVSYGILDLSSLQSVHDFVDHIKDENIDILVNNAALMPEKKTTKDGLDMQVQTNHLGPFLLTNLLLDRNMLAVDGRVVNVSSWMHINGDIHWNDLNYTKSYKPFATYCDTKLMNVLFSNELNNRFRSKRTYQTSIALHPGNVQTGFILHFIPAWLKALVDPLLSLFLLQTEESATKILAAAIGDEFYGVGGIYLSHGDIKRPAPAARNRDSMKRLWNVSERLVKYKAKWYK